MDFNALYEFLDELQNNNSRTWMNTNRGRYTALRTSFINWLEDLDQLIGQADPDYYHTPGRKAINRINNNLKFHPGRPVYKDYFGAALDKAPGTGDFYIQIGLNESLLAGGLWRPAPKVLRSVRDAIDYNGEELKKILSAKSFKQTFGGLYEDERLQKAPKGFSQDHPHINLLRNKTFAVVHRLSKDAVLKDGFKAHIVKVYLEMLPFRRYLNHAITV
jgi:uncharacterized protein (TIGR02453 family)